MYLQRIYLEVDNFMRYINLLTYLLTYLQVLNRALSLFTWPFVRNRTFEGDLRFMNDYLACSAKFPNGLYILFALIYFFLLFFFFFVFFNDFSETTYLRICWLDRFSQPFHRMKGFCVQMIDLYIHAVKWTWVQRARAVIAQ